MKIFVKKNAGVEYRKWGIQIEEEKDVDDLTEICREKWNVDEDTAILCEDEDGTEYDSHVKVSTLKGKVLVMREGASTDVDEETLLRTQVKRLNLDGLKGIKYIAIKDTLVDDDGSKERTIEFSSQTENQEKKSRIASVEDLHSWNVEGHINCLGVASANGGGGRSNSDVKKKESETEQRKQTNIAVVEKWGFKTLKKFKVQACIQENVLKEVNAIANLPEHKQAAQVRKMMDKYCGQIFEGSFYLGGYFQMRAITSSQGKANFSSLVNVANKELKRNWELGLSVDGKLLGVGAGASAGQNSRHGETNSSNNSSETKQSETETKIETESKPGNCKNMDEMESKLEFPSKWTVFRDPDARKEDFTPLHEILRRHGDINLVMVADVIELEELTAADNERLAAAEKKKKEMSDSLEVAHQKWPDWADDLFDDMQRKKDKLKKEKEMENGLVKGNKKWFG